MDSPDYPGATVYAREVLGHASIQTTLEPLRRSSPSCTRRRRRSSISWCSRSAGRTPARQLAGCQIVIEFQDPEGNNLEIHWNIDQVRTEGAVRSAREWPPAKTLEGPVANPVKGQTLPRRD